MLQTPMSFAGASSVISAALRPLAVAEDGDVVVIADAGTRALASRQWCRARSRRQRELSRRAICRSGISRASSRTSAIVSRGCVDCAGRPHSVAV